MVYYPVQIKSTLEPSSRSQVSYGPIHSAYCRFQTLCLVKERHRNKTKEQKSPNEWARFVEEKSRSIKIAHQMFWKIISAAPKKRKKKEKRKKETKFYFEGCVPRTSPLIFLKNHLSCLFHSSLEVNRFRECTAAIETFRRRTETACSVSALLVCFNQKALKLRKKITFCLVWNMVCLTRDVILTSCWMSQNFCREPPGEVCQWHEGMCSPSACYGLITWMHGFIFLVGASLGNAILHWV